MSEPFKSSPSGLRTVSQSAEVRKGVKALTERIAAGLPTGPEPEQEPTEPTEPTPEPDPQEKPEEE